MSTIWEKVTTALSGISTPKAAGIYIPANGTELPDSFITYQVVSNPPEQHADNKEILHSYRVQVTYYDRAGLAEMPDIKSAMISAGFMHAGGFEIPYDTVTRHFGLAMDFFLLESEE